MPTPEDENNIRDISQFRARGSSDEYRRDDPFIDEFTTPSVRIVGRNIYDESQIFLGHEPFEAFISRTQADPALDDEVRTYAINSAEAYVLDARAQYIGERIFNKNEQARAYKELAEYTWDRALSYPSDVLEEKVVELIQETFSLHAAAAFIKRLRGRTALTLEQQKLHQSESEQSEDGMGKSDDSLPAETSPNVTLFRRKKSEGEQE